MLAILTITLLSWVLINEWIGTYANRKHGNTYSSINRKRKSKK